MLSVARSRLNPYSTLPSEHARSAKYATSTAPIRLADPANFADTPNPRIPLCTALTLNSEGLGVANVRLNARPSGVYQYTPGRFSIAQTFRAGAGGAGK